MKNPTTAWRGIRAWAAQEMGTEVAAKLPEKFGKGTPEVQLVCDPEIAEEYRKEQEQKEQGFLESIWIMQSMVRLLLIDQFL